MALCNDRYELPSLTTVPTHPIVLVIQNPVMVQVFDVASSDGLLFFFDYPPPLVMNTV